MDIIISQGVEGPSIYLNRYRIAGPKPWGGSTACRTLKITARDIREALRGTEVDYAALERELAELREQRDGLETRCKRMSIAHAELEANCAALVEAVKRMRHANNKDRWDAFEWAESCAEVDRLLGDSAAVDALVGGEKG